MHFDLIDRVLEHEPGSIVTIKTVTNAEEYLRDHFPTFPVLPGVFMLEAMVQAGRAMLRREGVGPRHVLGQVKALKYGTFVSPGDTMRIHVSRVGDADAAGACTFKGSATVLRHGAGGAEEAGTCVSGRFVLRPLRGGVGGDAAAGGVPGSVGA